MQELTGRQRRMLKAQGQRLSPAVSVGKGGDSQAVVRQIDRLLGTRELVKVHLPAGAERKALGPELADRVGAVCVGVVGRTALLYRPNENLPDEQRIHLS